MKLDGLSLSVVGLPPLAAVMPSAIIPIWCFFILKKAVGLNLPNAGAIAAHYGSVSAVTFSVVLAFLEIGKVPVEGYVPALLAVMEAPAIIVAIFLALRTGKSGTSQPGDMKKLLHDLKAAGRKLVAFAIIMPPLHRVLGEFVGKWCGLNLGGTTVLATLAASASYIAAPAAVRIALPQASPALYLTSSLAITFPFNIVLGIPLYHGFAKILFNS